MDKTLKKLFDLILVLHKVTALTQEHDDDEINERYTILNFLTIIEDFDVNTEEFSEKRIILENDLIVIKLLQIGDQKVLKNFRLI